MKRVIVLTSSELRHTYFRMYLGLQKNIEVVVSFCESSEKNLVHKIENSAEKKLRHSHLQARNQVEKDFLQLFCDYAEDRSNPITISKGAINDPENVKKIIDLKPDTIVSFGSSIIKPALIDAFPGRFINVHLGLSPYYRGSGTNFWPFVNNAPEYCGVTFMKIDSGIDTGEVIHQMRSEMYPNDSFHVICNRLLVHMTSEITQLIHNFELLKEIPQIEGRGSDLYYKNSDFTEASVLQLYENFDQGIISKYLMNKEERDLAAPIIQNPALTYE
jgi:phosphoribosylglycinamide formyltransferase-1